MKSPNAFYFPMAFVLWLVQSGLMQQTGCAQDYSREQLQDAVVAILSGQSNDGNQDIEKIFNHEFQCDFDARETRSRLKKVIVSMLPRIEGYLRSEGGNISPTLLQMLSFTGPEANAVSPALRRVICNSHIDGDIRWQAFKTLCYVTKEDDSVLGSFPKDRDVLTADLERSLPVGNATLGSARLHDLFLHSERFAAILHSTGHTSAELDEIVTLAEKSESADARIFALLVIGELQLEATNVVHQVEEISKSSRDRTVRYVSCQAAILISPDCTLPPWLAELLNGDEAAFDSLQKMATERQESRKIEMDGYIGILRNGMDSKVNQAYVSRVFIGGNGPLKRQSLRAMMMMGSEARAYSEAIRPLLDDPNNETQRLAQDALRVITSDNN